MTVDPSAAVGLIHRATAGLADLGPQLAGVAPSGQFASVLAQVNTDMTALATGRTPTAPTPTPAPAPVPVATSADPAVLAGSAATAGAVPAALYEPALPFASGTAVRAATISADPVVADAERYLGVPYQWGGTDPATGLDCSGLVQRIYSDLGVQLPRTSQEQATVGTPVADLAQAQPGDLVFFEPSASGPGHVGIYIGGGRMIDAPHTGTVVRVDQVGQPSAIRRILPAGAAPAYGAFDTAAVTGVQTSAAMDRLGVPAGLQPLFSAAGRRYQVDPLLLAAVAKQESGFNPDAVSGAGAQGLMQLMPATAAGLGVSPLDPASAIDGAAQMLSGYLRSYGGSVPLALAAYNAGPNAVARYGGVPPYAETQNYVASVTAMLGGAGTGGIL